MIVTRVGELMGGSAPKNRDDVQEAGEQVPLVPVFSDGPDQGGHKREGVQSGVRSGRHMGTGVSCALGRSETVLDPFLDRSPATSSGSLDRQGYSGTLRIGWGL